MAAKSRRAVLRTRPTKARPLSGRGALPSEKSLIRKTPEELIRTLKRFNLEPDLAAIQKSADRAFEALDSILAKGQEPDAATWKAIEKRVENEVKGALVDMTKAAIRNYRLELARQQGGALTWVAVGDEGTCISCDGRHGQVKTYPNWVRSGLPGDAVLLCCSGPRKGCRCRLLPGGKE